MTQTVENPLVEGLELRRTPDPCVFVISGASGDLTQRKLFPALYALAARHMLPERFAVLGTARSPMSTDEFRKAMAEAVRKHARDYFRDDVWQELAAVTHYVPTEFDDEEGEDRVVDKLNEIDREHGTDGNRVHYLAVPPDAITTLVREIGERRTDDGWTRLIIEKPFGRDLASARKLNQEIRRFFREDEVFRIDHYLGKETVQNILVFRFGNSVFERVWNRDAVSHIEITVAESAGIEGRGEFYEEVGALRDVFQNHMLQILSLLTMEPPASFEAESIRNEKAKLLRAVRPLNPASAIRGQYTQGVVEGREVRGYLEEANVSPDSQTETFIAARVQIENWRWAGVPICLRTGKHLAGKATEIEIAFRDVPTCYFEKTDMGEMQANTLTLGIQPREEINFSFLAKVPGTLLKAKPVTMSFSYEEAFSDEPAEAYQRLLHDAVMGDSTLFVRSDSVERAWEIVQPVLDSPPALHSYAAGTWGPPAADDLIAPRHWHLH